VLPSAVPDQIGAADQLRDANLSRIEVDPFDPHEHVEYAVALSARALGLCRLGVPAPVGSAPVTGIGTVDMRPTFPPLDAEGVKNLDFSIFYSRPYLVCLDELAHGQKRSQPPPALRPVRTLAMPSAFMAHPAGTQRGRLSRVVRLNRHLGARPFGEDGEEAGDVLGYLPGVLAGQVTPEARLPDLARSVDQVVVRWFHRRPHGQLLAVPCLWPPVSESHR
jgi:hypothetical protein